MKHNLGVTLSQYAVCPYLRIESALTHEPKSVWQMCWSPRIFFMHKYKPMLLFNNTSDGVCTFMVNLAFKKEACFIVIICIITSLPGIYYLICIPPHFMNGGSIETHVGSGLNSTWIWSQSSYVKPWREHLTTLSISLLFYKLFTSPYYF